MVQHFHDGMKARVQNYGEFSEPFEVTDLVKQGCVMAPLCMTFSAMDAFHDSDTGFPIRYHFDGNVVNLKGLQAKPMVQTGVLDEQLPEWSCLTHVVPRPRLGASLLGGGSNVTG